MITDNLYLKNGAIILGHILTVNKSDKLIVMSSLFWQLEECIVDTNCANVQTSNPKLIDYEGSKGEKSYSS